MPQVNQVGAAAMRGSHFILRSRAFARERRGRSGGTAAGRTLAPRDARSRGRWERVQEAPNSKSQTANKNQESKGERFKRSPSLSIDTLSAKSRCRCCGGAGSGLTGTGNVVRRCAHSSDMQTFLTRLWKCFNTLPEGGVKMRLRFFLAFSPLVPGAVRRMSPIRASTFRHVPRPGEVIVDGGAFPGDFTVYASRKVGPSGRVLAFEPNPRNFLVLERSVRRAGCANVTLVPKGLWSVGRSGGMSGEGVDSAVAREGGSEHAIELVTLDGELASLGIDRVDFIKLDIEGAETEALRGAVDTLRRHPVRLAIGTYHQVEGHTTQADCERILAGLGYEFVTEYPKRPNTYAWKSATEPPSPRPPEAVSGPLSTADRKGGCG